MVEHNLAKVGVAGSSPVSRSQEKKNQYEGTDSSFFEFFVPLRSAQKLERFSILSYNLNSNILFKEVKIMSEIKEFLPFLIPLIIVEFALLGYTLYHILTHENYKRGNRTMWLVVVIVGMNYVGPILYFLLGKEDA